MEKGNRGKYFVEIHTLLLQKAFHYKSGFIPWWILAISRFQFLRLLWSLCSVPWLSRLPPFAPQDLRHNCGLGPRTVAGTESFGLSVCVDTSAGLGGLGSSVYVDTLTGLEARGGKVRRWGLLVSWNRC